MEKKVLMELAWSTTPSSCPRNVFYEVLHLDFKGLFKLYCHHAYCLPS